MEDDDVYCWEEYAVCGDCKMELNENQTMIFSTFESSTMSGFALVFSILGLLINGVTFARKYVPVRLFFLATNKLKLMKKKF